MVISKHEVGGQILHVYDATIGLFEVIERTDYNGAANKRSLAILKTRIIDELKNKGYPIIPYSPEEENRFAAHQWANVYGWDDVLVHITDRELLQRYYGGITGVLNFRNHMKNIPWLGEVQDLPPKLTPEQKNISYNSLLVNVRRHNETNFDLFQQGLEEVIANIPLEQRTNITHYIPDSAIPSSPNPISPPVHINIKNE